MRVLLVDDDEFDRETCRRVLESLSWQVLEASSPQEALDHLDDDAGLDAIISDYDLKTSQNGIDVLAHAMRVHPGSKRILTSGMIPPRALALAREGEEVQEFIEKPDTLDEWRIALSQALAHTHLATATVDGSSASERAPSDSATFRPTRSNPTDPEVLEARVRWLNAVVALGAEAHRGASLQETFDRAVAVVSETLDMEYSKILELLPGGEELRLAAGVGWQEGLVGTATVSTGMDSQAGYTLASEHPVLVEDLREETRFSGPTLLHAHGVVAGVSVIIPGENGKPWGVFGAHTQKRLRPTEDHALFLRAVANVVAGAIARARTEETLRNTKEVLEREVSARTRELQNAIDDLQAFNAAAAHDLRAPLRVVTQTLDILVQDHGDRLGDDAQDLVLRVQRGTRQMRQLVDDLLALAQAGQDPLEMRDVDVSALVKERWEPLQQREPEREVRFEVEEGLRAHADPRLLALAFDNLLGNAYKFTRNEPEAVVQVGSEHLDVGGTAFFVRDNGAGFASEHAGQLFHPFKRLHSTKEFEGTGIGLATVRRIVERHNGRIWAESPGPGQGATFYFRLLPSGLP